METLEHTNQNYTKFPAAVNGNPDAPLSMRDTLIPDFWQGNGGQARCSSLRRGEQFAPSFFGRLPTWLIEVNGASGFRFRIGPAR